MHVGQNLIDYSLELPVMVLVGPILRHVVDYVAQNGIDLATLKLQKKN